MLAQLEKKFRSSGLKIEDEIVLRNIISQTSDVMALISAIYIYGRSFVEHPSILKICERYIAEPVPGLTAKCMKVAIDFWGHIDKNLNAIEHYLDLALYDIWYDEVIFSVSFVNRHLDIDFSETVRQRFDYVSKSSEILSLDIL